MRIIENLLLRAGQVHSIDNPFCLDPAVLTQFLAAPYDTLPEFEGPPNYRLKRNGRGKDHPRYGRFVYALARHYRPDYIVEVGTFAGGTAVGFAKALVDNGHGRLICVDQDSYSSGTFPEVAQRNLRRVGLSDSQLELCGGDSKQWLPKLAEQHPHEVGIVLVDGDHTYEGALTDLTNAIPLGKAGGCLLVHDVDRQRRMDEATDEHPHPVYEAFHDVVADNQFDWCILKFIRKHLGIIQIDSAEGQIVKSPVRSTSSAGVRRAA
ncbi:MAG TPA: class I SAM-dependent methyltransferase [Pirellulaceae bacterium]|nr:class I SAM-dependent methyltransferase [Pirellulaceae bacterium]